MNLYPRLLCLLLFLPVVARAQLILVKQRGNASYYSDRLHGRTMSNGKPYHRDSMTCAHLRYPLGTWLRVRNLENNKEVVVQVTDRGPYSRKFVLDLSRAAARELGIIKYGYRQVEIIPFTPARVPFLYEPTTEKPEISLGFSDDEDDLQPYWQDSIYLSLTRDTTLLRRVKQSHKATRPQPRKSRKSRKSRGKH